MDARHDSDLKPPRPERRRHLALLLLHIPFVETLWVASHASLVVKFGALAFIFAPQNARQQAIDFQILGSVWTLQTLPAVVFGL